MQKDTGSFMSTDSNNTLLEMDNNNSKHLCNTYYMPDTVLSSSHVLTRFIHTATLEGQSCYYPCLQMGKLNHREVKYLAQCLTANE